MSSVVVREARSHEQIVQALEIRRRVFVDEQGIGEELEFDGLDGAATHLLALLDARPAAALRLRLLEAGRLAKIERVAVLVEARGGRVGWRLVRAALDLARAADARSALVHAQTRVQRFYARLGFAACGAEFVEDGIAHLAMRLSLQEAQISPAVDRPSSGGAA